MDVFSVILSSIQNFFNWLVNTFVALFDFLAALVTWILNGLGTIVQVIVDLANFLIQLVGVIYEFIEDAALAIILVLKIVDGIFRIVGYYYVQAIELFGRIETQFWAATPQPIIGLPQCKTAPTMHDLCAIYYTMDNTIFSGVGILMVQLLVIALWIYIVIYVVRTYLRINIILAGAINA